MIRLLSLSNLRIKWKIFALLLGFCGLLLVILWLFQTVLLDTFYKNVRLYEIKQDAALLAKSIDNENIAEIVAEISQNSETAIDLALAYL